MYCDMPLRAHPLALTHPIEHPNWLTYRWGALTGAYVPPQVHPLDYPRPPPQVNPLDRTYGIIS